MLNLPFEYIRNICDSNGLNISDEMLLVRLFDKYINHRDGLALLPEETKSLDWSLLKDEEKKAREEAKTLEGTEALARKEEQKKATEDAYNQLTPEQQYNRDWELKVDAIHKQASDRMKLLRLSKQEKKELFKTIRYSYCKHEDLLDLVQNPVFNLAKDYIVEGLSVRLNPYENAIKTEL